jgi:hypothetical protein
MQTGEITNGRLSTMPRRLARQMFARSFAIFSRLAQPGRI